MLIEYDYLNDVDCFDADRCVSCGAGLGVLDEPWTGTYCRCCWAIITGQYREATDLRDFVAQRRGEI